MVVSSGKRRFHGGWFIAIPFFWGWVGVTILDRILGLDTENMDPATEEKFLFWATSGMD